MNSLISEIHCRLSRDTITIEFRKIYIKLSVVESRDSYGYEISQTVKKAADIKESTLYPILKKLQSAGYLTTYSQEYQGRKRKYYSLTEEGKAQIAYLSNEWQIYKDTVDGIIEGRIRG